MTSMKTYSWIALATIVLFAAAPIPVSQAVMITIDTGSFADVTPGAAVDLSIGATEADDTVSYVVENTATVTGLAVDGGTVSGQFEVVYLHFDPVGEESASFSGSLTFDNEIAAIIGARDDLIPADAFFKPSDVTIDDTNRGQLNATDSVVASGNMLTINLIAGSGADDFRVLFRVPEPGTVALLGIGLLALGFLRRRKTPTNV
jgi:hypothetical protein